MRNKKSFSLDHALIDSLIIGITIVHTIIFDLTFYGHEKLIQSLRRISSLTINFIDDYFFKISDYGDFRERRLDNFLFFHHVN